MTLVDSNILIDVMSNDRQWSAWSLKSLAQRSALGGPLIINDIVYAEVAAQSSSERALNEDLRDLEISLERIPQSALFLAGKTFGRYRKAGGVRTGVLPDFFIGAHAQVTGLPLLTRDVRRYRTYFPDVTLITPDV